MEYRERHRHPGRPVRTVRPQPLASCEKFAGRVNTASASHDHRLQIQLRVIRAIERVHERLRLLDARALHFRGGVCGDRRRWRNGRWWWAEQSAFPDFDRSIGNAEDVRELRAAYCFLLLRPRNVDSPAGEFS